MDSAANWTAMKGLFILAAVSVLIFSCAQNNDTDDSWKYSGPVNSCTDDADCKNTACDTNLKICVLEPPNDGEQLYVKIMPELSSNIPSQVFSVEIDNDGHATETLTINTPVTVTGSTLAQVGANNIALSAQMIFTDVGNKLPGHPARVSLYNSDSTERFKSLELLPSVYNIMIIPKGTQALTCPVYYLDNIMLNTDGSLTDVDGNELDLVVPIGVSTVSGKIYRGNQPIDGLEVRAIDSNSGRVISTITQTSCVPPNQTNDICGDYSIKLAPDITQFDLRITRYQEPQHPIIVKTGLTASSEFTATNVYLEPLGIPIHYQAQILKQVTLPSGESINDPAPNYLVFFRSQSIDIGGGKVEHWVTTNESGYLEETKGVLGINLYQGCYDVIIVPQSITDETSVDYGISVVPEILCLSSDASKSQIDEYFIVERPEISGSVLVNGQKIPACTILAQPQNPIPGTARYNSTTTNSKGSFLLRLDASEYLIFTEAPIESNYAWGTVSWNVKDNLAKSLEIKIPYIANITIEPNTNQVIPMDISEATVEWYRVIDNKAYTVFRSLIDTNGHTHALLEQQNQ